MLHYVCCYGTLCSATIARIFWGFESPENQVLLMDSHISVRNMIISGNYVRIKVALKSSVPLDPTLIARLLNKMSDFNALPKMTPLEGESRPKRVVRRFPS
jgi:hypothetical protein